MARQPRSLGGRLQRLWIWSFLGLIFLPWTTLMFVAVPPSGDPVGWDWMWLGLGLMADLFSYSRSVGGRRSVPGYPAGY